MALLQRSWFSLARMSRQSLLSSLDALWPFTQRTPRPFQGNPLSRQKLQEVHACEAFAVLGDAGDRGPAQHRMAHQLIQAFRQRPFGCLLMLGDNVYEYGETRHFDASLGLPYGFFRERDLPCFAVLGNHDVRTARGELQLQYWGALPRYYQLTLAHGKVDIFALDTTLFAPGAYGCYATPDEGVWAQALASQQLVWLQQALRASQAPMKIVVGHYPLYSSGPHGLETAMQAHLRQLLEPLLTDPVHGIQLYLAGHEHLFEVTPPLRAGQRCSADQGGVVHMVSGAAGRVSQLELSHPPHPRCIALAQYHFVRFEWVEAQQLLRYSVIGSDGQGLGDGTILARGATNGAREQPLSAHFTCAVVS